MGAFAAIGNASERLAFKCADSEPERVAVDLAQRVAVNEPVGQPNRDAVDLAHREPFGRPKCVAQRQPFDKPEHQSIILADRTPFRVAVGKPERLAFRVAERKPEHVPVDPAQHGAERRSVDEPKRRPKLLPVGVTERVPDAAQPLPRAPALRRAGLRRKHVLPKPGVGPVPVVLRQHGGAFHRALAVAQRAAFGQPGRRPDDGSGGHVGGCDPGRRDLLRDCCRCGGDHVSGATR